ncbi:adenylate cyclase [Humidesulfovibrio mexicanus]|uniref:Adenylate cyclase n=1 Tax=Humidesulfovibrio mexicanus TaxID=147047 RepID=A0A238YA49_9BACT|nr:adenylate/guanylate cyclase domain-containing protein [Humidesulfovibrio mexicanus]SNR68017.1 adenylate cyclase [Humidesulfovibrio mexicanus]
MPALLPPLPPPARGLLVAGLAVALLSLTFALAPQPFERLELAASDLRLRLAPRPQPSPDVVLLTIDDATLGAYGGWPLPRAVHARVIDTLTRCGVSLVAFDIVFRGAASGESGPAEDTALEEAIRRNGRVLLPVGVALVRETEVVRLSPEPDDLPLLPSLIAPGDLRVQKLLQTEQTVLPAARFSRHALGLGHIAATPDADGAYRRMPLLVGYHGQVLPALALRLAASHLKASIEPHQGRVDLVREGLRLPIPTDASGVLAVNFAAPWGRGFWHLSYAETLDAAGDPARMAFLRQGLEGKAVLVGLAASGTTDIKATALSRADPLVTLHANLASQILTRASLPATPPWAGAVMGAVFLAAAALLYLRLPLRLFLPSGILLALLCPAANMALYAATGLAPGLVAPSLAVTTGVLALLADALARTARDTARQRRILEAYFSPSIARQILDSGEDIMQGRSVDLTILFADIAGFTAMSDRMDPAEVQRFLGEYFEEMTACVFRNQGAVDKYMGDGLMAFFGYPETDTADSLENARLSAVNGVRAAVEMQAAVSRLNLRWREQGRQAVAVRIGVNTGHAIVGDMGSASRREFTVLGRNVNMAQRLEGAASPGDVLLSARTAALVRSQFRLREPIALRLKGFDKEMEARPVELPEV